MRKRHDDAQRKRRERSILGDDGERTNVGHVEDTNGRRPKKSPRSESESEEKKILKLHDHDQSEHEVDYGFVLERIRETLRIPKNVRLGSIPKLVRKLGTDRSLHGLGLLREAIAEGDRRGIPISNPVGYLTEVLKDKAGERKTG